MFGLLVVGISLTSCEDNSIPYIKNSETDAQKNKMYVDSVNNELESDDASDISEGDYKSNHSKVCSAYFAAHIMSIIL